MTRTLQGWVLVLVVAAQVAVAIAQSPPEASLLPKAPELDSPRATLATFVGAMQRVSAGDDAALETVLACFDTPLANRVDLKGTARQLYAILDRLNDSDLAGTPGAAALAARAQAEGFKARRYVLFPRPEHAWVWEKLGHAPDGEVVMVADAGDQWRFDTRTIMGVDRLYESVKDLPPRGEAAAETLAKGHEGEPVFTLLGPTFDRTQWWGWGVLLLGIFAGLASGKLAQAFLKGMAERFEARGWPTHAVAVRSTLSPASLALLTTGVFVGLRFVHMEPVIVLFAHRVVALLYLIAVAWALYNLVEVLEAGLRGLVGQTGTKLDDMLLPLLRKSLRIFLIIIFTLVVAQNVFGLNITGWLAGLGIAGLAVSLAAQDSVKNLFGSITVLLDKPFVVGDRIVFDGVEGTVEEIGFRSTRIRTLVGHLVTVPNMRFIDNKVENVAARKNLRRILDVTVTYDTPLEKIEEGLRIIRGILAEAEFVEPFDMEKSPPRVYFNDYNAASLNLRVMYWYQLTQGRDWWSYNEHAERFNLRLLRAFADAGIEFAFPTQTLYLAGDPKRPLEGRPA